MRWEKLTSAFNIYSKCSSCPHLPLAQSTSRYWGYLSQLGMLHSCSLRLPVLPHSVSCTLRALQDSEELIYHIQGTPRLFYKTLKPTQCEKH